MHLRLCRLILTSLLVAGALLPLSVAAADPEMPPQISAYWHRDVQHWNDIIVEEATQRGLDPDLIAAVIWKESLGRSYTRSPAGAVGLMGIMPREAGFGWRPTAAQLQDPATNVFWGTRTLSIIIGQAHGDLYRALAAYNGGWAQADQDGPRRYAASVLDSYAQAVTLRYGLPAGGHWVVTIAAMGSPDIVTVIRPQHTIARYTHRPVLADIPEVTTSGPPTVVVFYPTDGRHMDSCVGIWISMDGALVRQPREPLSTWLTTGRGPQSPLPAP